MNFTSFPLQDYYESTLPADIDAVVTTIGVSVAPSFTISSGKCYAAIDYDKPSTKVEIISFTGISGNNLTGVTRGIAKYSGGASTAQTHASGAKIIMSDNWQQWKDIADAIASKFDTAGGTISGALTVSGATQINNTLGVTGAVTLTTDLAVAHGGTGASTAADARTNLDAAQKGANSDITSLSALSTPLSVSQGGTGKATITAKSLVVGNGTGAVAELAPGVASKVVISNGTDWTVGDVPPMGVAKKLLSSTNTTDGNDDDVARGAIIVGNSTPKWDALPIGAAGTALVSDGTDVSWGNVTPFGWKWLTGPTFGGAYNQGFVSFDELSLSHIGQTATNSFTRTATSKLFTNVYTSNNHGGNVVIPAYYRESNTDWLLVKTSGAQSFTRNTFNSSATQLLTVSGTSPTTINVMAWDATNNRLLVREGTTTQIRRYSISGTTMTNVSSDITLSSNPTDARAMWVVGTEIWILDVASSTYYIRKYSATGTLLSSTALAPSSAYMYLFQKYNGDCLYVVPTVGTTPVAYAQILDI